MHTVLGKHKHSCKKEKRPLGKQFLKTDDIFLLYYIYTRHMYICNTFYINLNFIQIFMDRFTRKCKTEQKLFRQHMCDLNST